MTKTNNFYFPYTLELLPALSIVAKLHFSTCDWNSRSAFFLLLLNLHALDTIIFHQCDKPTRAIKEQIQFKSLSIQFAKASKSKWENSIMWQRGGERGLCVAEWLLAVCIWHRKSVNIRNQVEDTLNWVYWKLLESVW